SEEHTSELQSLTNLVCRLLLEKKNSKRPLSALPNCSARRHGTVAPLCSNFNEPLSASSGASPEWATLCWSIARQAFGCDKYAPAMPYPPPQLEDRKSTRLNSSH